MRLAVAATTLIFALFPITALAGKGRDATFLRSRHAEHAAAIRARAANNYTGGNPPYHLREHYEGESFFDDWAFTEGDDPTHGLVNYQSRKQALAKKLAYVKDGTTVLTVDSTSTVPVGGKRDSVRITSKKTWDRGLFIADFAFMPHGCSVWPAYWSVGPNWPNAGEIDILEGVHNQPTNQYTLHTGSACALPTNGTGIDATGNLIYNGCQSLPTDNRGCGFLDSDTRSYGSGFNSAGGGVLAHEWNSQGVKIWFFPREEVPADITKKQPNPSSWGVPIAAWSSKFCDISSALYQHSLIIDTTICGDWAGPAYEGSGCPGTCAEAVADPSNFAEAKWGVNYISVFQS